MNRFSKLVLVVATTAAVGSAGTVIAFAAWPVPSRPVTMKVHIERMPSGVRPSVARSGADAVVTWSPQEIGPGTVMQSYVVRRHDAKGVNAAQVFAPTSKTTLTDSAVPPGTWYWTITPRFATWVGDEGKKSENVKFEASPGPVSPAVVAGTSATPTPAATPSASPAVIDGPKPEPIESGPTPLGTPSAQTPTPGSPSGSPDTTMADPPDNATDPADVPGNLGLTRTE